MGKAVADKVMSVSALGLALGLAWALSPLAMLFGGATIWMCLSYADRLDGRERTHVSRILAVAVGARMLAIALLLIATRPDREPFLALFPDARYTLDRSLWIRNVWLGVAIGPHQSIGIFDPYAASSLPWVFAVLQMLAGPSPYALSLISVGAFTAGSLLIHRMVRESFGGPAATVALAVTMLWPTLFAWSLSVLRESLQFFLSAVVVASLFYVVRDSRLWARAGCLAAFAAGLAAMQTLGSGLVEIALLATLLAVVFRMIAARASIVIALVILGGFGFWRMQDRIVSTVRLAADRHVGHVQSAGRSYRLLDEKYYAAGTQSLTSLNTDESLAYLARSAGAFVVEPKPWRAESLSEIAQVPEQALWYLALAGALIGIAAGRRRDAWLTSILAAYPIAGLIIIAPNSGNIGTLVRHRDTIVPFVLALGAAGLIAMMYRAPESAQRVEA